MALEWEKGMTNTADIRTRLEITRALLSISAAVRALATATKQDGNKDVTQALDEVAALTTEIIERLGRDINQ